MTTYRERVKRRSPLTALKAAFRAQRNSAIRERGIAWEMTFEEWLDVWTKSGKLALRGKGRGKYVMSRPNDVGPYKVGNVRIILGTRNVREAQLGKPESPEAIEKNRRAQTGRKHSARTRMQMSRAQKGKVFSDLHRARMCDAQRKRFARERQERDLCSLYTANYYEEGSVKATPGTDRATYNKGRQRIAEARGRRDDD